MAHEPEMPLSRLQIARLKSLRSRLETYESFKGIDVARDGAGEYVRVLIARSTPDSLALIEHVAAMPAMNGRRPRALAYSPRSFSPDLSISPAPAPRPVQPGMSIRRHRNAHTVGTFGAFVRNDRDQVFLLSNWHVLVKRVAPKNDLVALYHRPSGPNGRQLTPVAAFSRPRDLPTHGPDAALARVIAPDAIDPGQSNSDRLIAGVRLPRLGDIVQKSGDGARSLSGRVDGIGYYRTFVPHNGSRWFAGIRIVPAEEPEGRLLSKPGDSGSLWFTRDEPSLGIGLHFAGQLTEEYGAEARAHVLDHVLARFKVTLAIE